MWTDFKKGYQAFAMWTADYLNDGEAEGHPYATVEMTTTGCMLNYYLPWNSMMAWYKNHGFPEVTKESKKTYTDADVDEVTKFTWDVLSFWFADRGTKGTPLFINEDALPDFKRPCATFAIIEGPQMMINDKTVRVLKAKPRDIIDLKTYQLKAEYTKKITYLAKTTFNKPGTNVWTSLDAKPTMTPHVLLHDYTKTFDRNSELGKKMYDPVHNTIKKPWAPQDIDSYWGCLLQSHYFPKNEPHVSPPAASDD